MYTLIKTSRLSWYITAACRKCHSGSASQNWIYFSTIPHRLWRWFYNNNRKDNKKIRQLGWYFQKQSWNATRGIPVQHRKRLENPDVPFRGTPQGKQKLTYWLFVGRPQGKQKHTYRPFRGRPQGKQQLNFWPDIGRNLLVYWEKYIHSEATTTARITKKSDN